MKKSPENEFKRISKNQKEYASEIARKLKAGKSLDITERLFAAAALEFTAKSFPEKSKRLAGQEAKFSHGDMIWMYGLKVSSGSSKNKAYEELAEQFGVSETAIKNALKNYLSQVENTVSFLKYASSSKK